MALDPQYIDAIKGFEGYSTNAAWDYKQSSSGYGTRARPGDENIPPDQLKAIHEQRLQEEVGKAAAAVDSFNPNLPPGARAALISLTYNAGPGWQQSGLGEAVKAGDWDRAKGIFLQYNKAGGEVNPGLVARRQKEAAWFGGELPQAAPQAPASPAAPQPGGGGLLDALTGAAGMIRGLKGEDLRQTNPPANLGIRGDIGSLLQLPQQAQQAGGLFAQMPAEQGMPLAPIQFAQRRSPDLSKLRAAFKPPVFSRG
jgi:lysozyme